MTPEKLQSWIYRPVSGSSTLSLTYEPPLGQSSVVATWTREEVERTREESGSQGDEVLTAARDYMEQLETRDSAKFVLAWYGERRVDPLRSTPLKLKPEDQPSALPLSLASVATGDHALLVTVIVQLLGTLERKDRISNASQGIVLAAYERALNMQQRVNDSQATTIEHLRSLMSSLTDSDSDRGELADVKARALDKLVQALPAVVNMGVQLVTANAGPQKPSREQRMTAARSALGALQPDEIAELGSEDDNANGATSDDAPQH